MLSINLNRENQIKINTPAADKWFIKSVNSPGFVLFKNFTKYHNEYPKTANEILKKNESLVDCQNVKLY